MRRQFVLFVLLLVAGCTSAGQVPNGRLISAPPAGLDLGTPVVTQRAYSAIVVDVDSGRILHETDARALRYPASLTKMMTLYMLFEQLDAGRLALSSNFTVSASAASRPPSKLGLKAGQTLMVETAVRALAVKSANDVAVVIAENLAGSEPAFARAMTQQARALGMNGTQFVNASGLPDPRQVTTAMDMAILGRALSDRHPKYFRYFSAREISWHGRTYKSTNKLLGKVAGVDGIKTGFIRASGFNLVASVRRDGKHIIAVVIGGTSGSARNRKMEELIQTYLPQRGSALVAAAPSATELPGVASDEEEEGSAEPVATVATGAAAEPVATVATGATAEPLATAAAGTAAGPVATAVTGATAGSVAVAPAAFPQVAASTGPAASSWTWVTGPTGVSAQ